MIYTIDTSEFPLTNSLKSRQSMKTIENKPFLLCFNKFGIEVSNVILSYS